MEKPLCGDGVSTFVSMIISTRFQDIFDIREVFCRPCGNGTKLAVHNQASDHSTRWSFNICKQETTGYFQLHVGIFSDRVSSNPGQ